MSWRELTLDQIGEVSRGRSRHRPRDAAHLYGGSFPFVQTSDVTKANLYLTSFDQTYSEAGLAQSKLWPSGTLCITIAANIADTAILGIDACFPDSVIGFRPDPDKADTRFVKYLFDGVLKVRYRSFTQGAAQDNLSQEKLLSVKFPVPPLIIQQRVADLLSAYDDLIENNRRRIGLLDEAARMLYREWFVHFRFPGHEHVRIIDGVPEGWERRTLGDVAETNVESYGTGHLPDEIRYIDISSVSNGRVLFKSKISSAEAPGRARRKIKDGDLIWSNVRPNLRAFALILEPEEFDVVSTGFTVLSSSKVPFTWLYMVATTDTFVSYLVNHATGAGYPAVRPDDFERAQVLLPSRLILDQFHEAIAPNFRLTHKLEQQNQKLAQARDLLLPRLMNGEIAV